MKAKKTCLKTHTHCTLSSFLITWITNPENESIWWLLFNFRFDFLLWPFFVFLAVFFHHHCAAAIVLFTLRKACRIAGCLETFLPYRSLLLQYWPYLQVCTLYEFLIKSEETWVFFILICCSNIALFGICI